MRTVEDSPIVASRRGASRALIFWGVAMVVVLLDQVTKAIVRATLERGEVWPDWDLPFRLRYVTNSGASFGILEGQTAFLIVMAVIGLGAIFLYYRNPPFDHWTASAGIGLLLGGALGNLIDRVRLGRVTDFLDPDNFPAFNVADSSINVGIAVLVLGYLVFGQGGNRKSEIGMAGGGETVNQQTIQSANQEPDAGTPPFS